MPEEIELEQSETPTDESAQTVSEPVAFDRAGLEAKVQESMAAAFQDDDEVADEATDEAAAPEATSEEATDETPATDGEIKEVTDEPTEAAAEKKIGTVAKPAVTDPNAPTLPAAHRRSLKAYGWEDAEIDQNLQALGEKFLSTAARIHKNRNDEISTWADAGRKARDSQQTTQQSEETATAPQPKPEAKKPSGKLERVDVAALKKQYGEDDLIDKLVGPINTVVDQINTILPAVQQTQERSQKAETEALGRHIEGFFGGKELTPYKDFYGDGKSAPTQEQVTSRNKVLETADALIVGARLQGRQLSLDDALTLAHDSVSSGYKIQAARTELKQQLKTREKGISLRPSGKGGRKDAGVKTRSDLEKKVSTGLRTVFA